MLDEVKKLQDAKHIHIGDYQKVNNAKDFIIQERKWAARVNHLSKNIHDASEGTIKTVNYSDLDRLINVRGKKRPIAVFVRPRSSNLSHGGAFIYDTRNLEDNALYLFAGTKCPDSLIKQAEILLRLMNDVKPANQIYRLIRDYNSDDFKHMIHQIGGHIDQIQSVKNAGDELFFENQFYKTLLNIKIFNEGKNFNVEFKNNRASLSDFPTHGAGVIDTSDLALYLYIPNRDSEDVKEREDVLQAALWMANHTEYRGREVLIFNAKDVPPNIAIIFGISYE